MIRQSVILNINIFKLYRVALYRSQTTKISDFESFSIPTEVGKTGRKFYEARSNIYGISEPLFPQSSVQHIPLKVFKSHSSQKCIDIISHFTFRHYGHHHVLILPFFTACVAGCVLAHSTAMDRSSHTVACDAIKLRIISPVLLEKKRHLIF
jgi:hypothetical protein